MVLHQIYTANGWVGTLVARSFGTGYKDEEYGLYWQKNHQLFKPWRDCFSNLIFGFVRKNDMRIEVAKVRWT